MDRNWFGCIYCARRPLPNASYNYLLTSCSHILCSSCWERRGSSECPKCGAKANALDLSASSLPKVLVPYFTDPAVLIRKMLKIYEFQEHQKEQMRGRREAVWAVIGIQRAKEDYEREYAECKALQRKQLALKREVKILENLLCSHGIDPSQHGIPVYQTTPHPTPHSSPFVHSPMAIPPCTSTPALPAGGYLPTVEFVEPKKLPHTMRGSVTSKAARWSPSNRPKSVPTPNMNVIPVKRLYATTPMHVDGQQQQRLTVPSSAKLHPPPSLDQRMYSSFFLKSLPTPRHQLGNVRSPDVRFPSHSSTQQRIPPPPQFSSTSSFVKVFPTLGHQKKSPVSLTPPSGLTSHSASTTPANHPRPYPPSSMTTSHSTASRAHPAVPLPQPSPHSHPGVPTNPSPLLRAYTTTRGSVSPWQRGYTPPPGARLSGGMISSGRVHQLTPVRCE